MYQVQVRLCLIVTDVVGLHAALKIFRHPVADPTVQQGTDLRERLLTHQVLCIALAAELRQGTDDQTEHEATDHHSDNGGDHLHCSLRDDVAVADCCHGHHAPVHACEVPRSFRGDATGCVDVSCRSPHAEAPVNPALTLRGGGVLA
eukprot:COSAG05_NODE_2242_length_3351_cov_2.034133_2_plen_147_part_00